MLLYEVNLTVDGDAAEEMAVWLRDHVREMQEIDGFDDVAWYQLDPEDGRQRWSIHYHVQTMRHLQDYLDHHAARMRADGQARFGGRFTAGRRVLYLRETFAGPDKNP